MAKRRVPSQLAMDKSFNVRTMFSQAQDYLSEKISPPTDGIF
jgi:hypothetical protein